MLRRPTVLRPERRRCDGHRRYGAVRHGGHRGGPGGPRDGYHLKRRGRPFVILDADERVGDAGARGGTRCGCSPRLDTMALPGFRSPHRGGRSRRRTRWRTTWRPTPPVRARREDRHAGAVGARRQGDRYVVKAAGGGSRRTRRRGDRGVSRPPAPAFASELDPSIVQLHSSEYRRPSQLREGAVLLVGAGNSGADIALELVADARDVAVRQDSGHIPVRHRAIAAPLPVCPVRRSTTC